MTARAARAAGAQRDRDRAHMARCLELARGYRGRTSPNPIVGCVIVGPGGDVLAEGAHKAAGKPHAEIDALRKLGGRAPGATLYVNLEPCLHHGRTPPCAPAVREAGVARVVVGSRDPVPGHGGGIAHLRRAGIAVTTGVLRAECDRANKPFFTWAERARPMFTLKAAITLDGKICTVAGQSKWVTGEAARDDVAALRDQHDAVLVGIGTVLADDPWLTARIRGGRDPQRIVVDSQLRTPVDARLLPKKHARSRPRTIIACGPKAPEDRERRLVARGAEVWRLPAHANGRVDLLALGKRLADHGVTSVLVEGGAEIHAYMIEHELADELIVYVAPKVVGGLAKGWVGGKGLATMAAAHAFVFDERFSKFASGDIKLTATPAPRKGYAAPLPDDV